MMRILNLLNVSNKSNLQADSGFVFQQLLMREVLKQRPDWLFYFISPSQERFPDGIRGLYLEYGSNKYEVRYNFPWASIVALIEPIIDEIDVVHVNQSEQAANVKALLASLRPKRNIPFLTYFHYMPIEPSHLHYDDTSCDRDYEVEIGPTGIVQPSNIRYDKTLDDQGLGRINLLRQIEALHVSDFNVTCSSFAVDLLFSNAQRLVPSTMARVAIIPPPVSFEEANINCQRAEKHILFNHRLYHHYGPAEFFSFMDWFYEKVRKDFIVILTDPTHGRSLERHRLDTSVNEALAEILARPYIGVRHGDTRREYYQTVAESSLCIGPLKPSALWSMSVVDAMACGVPVLCPNYACFPEIVGASSGLLFSTKEELASKIQRIFDDVAFAAQAKTYVRKRAENFEVRKTAAKFIEIYEKLVGEHA